MNTQNSISQPAISMLATSHRTAHGGSAWMLTEGATQLQPQDGATHNTNRQQRVVTAILNSPAKGFGGFSSVVTDPEDAQLTGGTRSLMRRLLGLNLRTSAKRFPRGTAAQPAQAA